MEAIDYVLDSDKYEFKKFIECITKGGEDKKNYIEFNDSGFSQRFETTISDLSIGDSVCIKDSCLNFTKRVRKIFTKKDEIIIVGFFDGFYDVYEGIVQVMIYFKNKKIENKFCLIGIDSLEKKK